MTFHRCLLDPVLLTGLIMSLHVATGCIEIEEGSVCTSNGSSYTLFGTKTTYVNARAELAKRFDFDESKLSQLIQDLNCGLTPTRMYVFARHSIKYPKANAIAQMQNLHSYYIPIVQANVARTLQNQQSCSSVLNAVIDWTPKFEKKLAYQITESGLNETKFIARRMQQLFPTLLTNETDIQTAITYKKRTQQTMEAYMTGLGFSVPTNQTYTIDENLYFHDFCKQLFSQNGILFNKPILVQDWRRSDIMMLLELSVAKRVGLQNRMTSELLDIMYQTCSYETAIYGKSGWCSVFTPDELRLLEYIENATAYLEDGRHRAVNRRMACPLVNSIVSFLRPNRTGPHTFVGISHAGAIKPLLATLNTHAWFSKIDFDLKASYCQRKPDAWDLSVHVSFNSNFNFVLYERKHRNASIESQCAECHKWIGNKTDQYFVLTLFNERPIALDGCSQMLCPWSEFEAQFNRLSADCDLNQICNV